MAEIRWTDLAIENLNHIGNHIEQDIVNYEEIVVNKIFDVTKKLERYPYAGRMVPEFPQKHIRELTYCNYRIIYAIISEDVVDVLALHHSTRV
jgi:plasmid stabilization system protein ParE